MNRIAICMLLVLTGTAGLWADRLLDPNETEAVLRSLTDTPRQAWIDNGMIEARHLEYYEYDSSIRETSHTVHRKGDKYRLEVIMKDGLSTDPVPDIQQSRLFQQDLALNRNRIYVWDGQKYTRYYQSADYAEVIADAQDVPSGLCGPVTAGIVPWGHGDFSYLVLASQSPTCRAIRQDDRDVIVLSYQSSVISPATEISFVLDPVKDYAVLSYRIENSQALLQQTYEEYQQVSQRWIPLKILIERFDKRSGAPELISYEDWQIETIDPTLPADEEFSVDFKTGTLVELKAAYGLKPFMYNASDQADIASLLADKINLLQSPDPESVNCATAAIQHVTKRFSKTVLQPELSSLVSPETKQTALSDMKLTFEGTGLTCMAVATDLEMLDAVPNCSIILYLGLSNHYVVFDHIDSHGVWLIDLTDRKFYARQGLDEFLQEWNSGIALLVSDGPITPPLDANFRYLEPAELTQIHGGGGFGNYSCTDLIQEYEIVNCPEPIGGFMCHGAYYVFSTRYGCIEDETGGTCTGDKMISYSYYHCVNNPQSQGACLTLDEAITRYIRACR